MKRLIALFLVLFCATAQASVQFDGTDDITTGQDINAIDGLATMTISCWMKRNASGSIVILGKGSSFSSDISVELWSDSNAYVEIGNGGNTYGAVANTSTAWQHMVLVYDGTQTNANTALQNAARLKLYINGVSQTLTYGGTIPATTASNSGLFNIGNVDYSSSKTTGLIDDVMLFNVALTADEVATIYNSRKRLIVRRGLIGYWPMNDNTDGSSADGDTIRDIVGGYNCTGNDGANNTGLTWQQSTLLSSRSSVS